MNKDNNFEMNFTLKKLRLFREFDQKVVAEKIGLTASGYGKKESGQREFTATELNLLAKFFNKSMDEMFIIIKNKN